MRPRRALLALAILAVPAGAPAAMAAGYGTTGGQAPPAELAGGAIAPEADPAAPGTAQPGPRALVQETLVGPAGGISAGTGAAPATRRAWVPDPLTAAPVARAAQDPVEPDPGVRPGDENREPASPFEPTPSPELREDERREEEEAAELPLSGLNVKSVFFGGALLLALAIGGLAVSRARLQSD